MIKQIKHKGLKRLFVDDDPRGVPSYLAQKLKLILGRLHVSEKIEDMRFSGYRLHPLKGSLGKYWSITVTGNMRLIFQFDEIRQEVYAVDLIDYH